jgi:hypothetical protein
MAFSKVERWNANWKSLFPRKTQICLHLVMGQHHSTSFNIQWPPSSLQAENALSVLALANRSDIPVYIGAEPLCDEEL